MKTRFLEAAIFIAIAIGLILMALLVVGFMKYEPTKSGDWATWVGAIFTGAAFAGTIWLATFQERLRRQKDRNISYLVAARISGEIADELRKSINLYEKLFAHHWDNIHELWQHLPTEILPRKESSLCNVELLAQLVPLPNYAAHRIARAVGLLQAQSADMARYADEQIWKSRDRGRCVDSLFYWKRDVKESSDLLSAALLVCQTAAGINIAKLDKPLHFDKASSTVYEQGWPNA